MTHTELNSSRISSIDILRGLTVAGMILVNNPGGGDENTFAPLLHADWFGLTPTDLVFPLFMFIMGITTYLSLQKFEFKCSRKAILKILRRSLALWLIGLSISWLIMFTRGMISPDYDDLNLWQRLYASANTLDHIRILGVLPRLGICYGLAATTALICRHRYLPLVIILLFVGYYAILELCNGYAHDATNIVAVIDNAILGPSHVYRWESPDPEGILSTLPALAHVLIGFLIGKHIASNTSVQEKREHLFIAGSIMLLAGLLLSYACPISKKLWTPTFSLTTCGIGATLLALTMWLTENCNASRHIGNFFRAFGANPLAMFIISDILLIPFSILHLANGTTIQHFTYDLLAGSAMPRQCASLIWALIYVAINWTCGYYLYKRKIYIRI